MCAASGGDLHAGLSDASIPRVNDVSDCLTDARERLPRSNANVKATLTVRDGADMRRQSVLQTTVYRYTRSKR